MSKLLYYPFAYDPAKVATLGTELDEKDGKILIQNDYYIMILIIEIKY